MIKQFNSHVFRHLSNIPGWHTRRKIVVIESDDWGSIRMPSKEVYNTFLRKGIRVDKDPYCKYDSLATKQDLEALFEVLSSVKDKNGRFAVLTANAVVANPSFEKIRSSGFQEYHYELFTETLKRQSPTDGAFNLWKEGKEAGFFYPQFHGREHLNVKKWMSALRNDDEITRIAFDVGTFGLTHKVDHRSTNYMGAFNSGLKEDLVQYQLIIQEGLDLFEKLFRYRSLSFIPTTYTWSPDIEGSAKKNGVKYLQGMVVQRIPLDDDTTFYYKKTNFTGRRSKAGLIYLMRNCYFEPSQNPNNDWVNDCLKRIKIAFMWNKPAIISMHRLNVIGAINENNRTQNLKLIKQLLNEILKRHPDVEFMSSEELGVLIESAH